MSSQLVSVATLPSSFNMKKQLLKIDGYINPLEIYVHCPVTVINDLIRQMLPFVPETASSTPRYQGCPLSHKTNLHVASQEMIHLGLKKKVPQTLQQLNEWKASEP